LAVADPDDPVVAAHCCQRHQHAVLTQAIQEVFAQIDCVPDVLADLDGVRIEVFQATESRCGGAVLGFDGAGWCGGDGIGH
jgi:hypothetical protein